MVSFDQEEAMAQAATTDQRYEKSELGKARAARYAAGEKGLARRRRWADANRPALAKYARERRAMLREFEKAKKARRLRAARVQKKLKK